MKFRSLITETCNKNLKCHSKFLRSQDQDIFFDIFLKGVLKVQFGSKGLSITKNKIL